MAPVHAAVPAGLVARVKGILLTPRAEWEVVAAEPATPAGIWTGYVLPLVAIGPVAGLLGGLAFGTPVANLFGTDLGIELGTGYYVAGR